MRGHPWASTPLGPPQCWPEGLKVALRMMLASRFEMWLGWGEDMHFFYNDAYIPTLGVKHPGAIGRPTREVWGEVYDDMKGRFDAVLRDGEATWDKALRLLLERNGYPEETYHTFSYSPLRGASGAIEGLMCVVSEETERVISERRLELLRSLSAALLPARTRKAVVEGVRRALRGNTLDFPFSLVRLFEGAPDGDTSALEQAPWPFDLLHDGAAGVRIGLVGVLDDPPKGAWDIAPREALIAPIFSGGQGGPSGALVLGLNPYRPQDPDIAGFSQLVCSQISGALATVDAQVREVAEMERLRQLFEQSPSFMAVLRGPHHRFELVNPRYLQLIAHRDVIGKAVRDALPELEGQGFFKLLDEVYDTGEPFIGRSVPITLQRTPGAAPEPCFLDFVYQPMRSAEGVVTGIFVEGVDVTAAHDVAVALRASEAQFRAFAEAMPNHVWAAPPNGQIDWFNNRAYQYAGAKPGALAGDGWTRLVHPDDLAPAVERWAAALAGGEPYETEFRLRRADGLYRWHLARAVPIRGDDGAILRWIGANTDIEDQKSTAEALAYLNSTLESQVEDRTRERDSLWAMSRDLLAIVGEDGCYKRTNPAWTTQFGIAQGALAHAHFNEVFHPDDRHGVEQVYQRMRAGAPVAQFEARIRAAEGAYRTVSWVVVATEGDYYASGRDVTDQRRTEEALRQSQKMEAVGQLTGGIAHDFNNLLTGISGSLQLLEARITQGRLDSVPRYIDAAHGAAKRAAALTQRLLAFSRRQTLDPRPVNVNRLIGDMEELIRRTVGPSVQMEVVGAGGVWPTLVDSNQLENALLNLCINARDAMPDGGRITIETANKWLDDRAAASRELPPGQYVSLCVTDTGTGMTPEVIARAFDPFFTTKPLGAGTGLGLSMIYGFVRQSGGQVCIYSEIGLGASICLYLPRYGGAAEDGVAETAVSHPLSGGHGETVLIVDDEPTVRMLVTDVLDGAGYNAIEAADGAAGLKVLESGARVDLLITDVGLPGGMNGRQVADAGRVLRPGLKVLFITGYAENAVIGSGRLDPGMQVITKPFAVEALGEKIRQMIDS
ncbi:MAG: sensory box protein [Caulobacteraceae bacterium]|nr:sensory box protein [Caulobacteraceae bacterium]